jgi:hypothetical protein
MTDRDFCYWLRGYFELSPALTPFTPEQMSCIQKHLDLVFENVTENKTEGESFPAEVPFPIFERDVASIAHVVSRRC